MKGRRLTLEFSTQATGGITVSLWQPLTDSDASISGFRGLHEDLGPVARPLGVPSAMSNLHISPAPALSTRPGLTLLGTAGVGKVNGLHILKKLDGTTQLLRHTGTRLDRWTGTAWVNISTTLPDSPSTSANLNDKLCIFTGTNRYKWSGTALTTLAGAPQGKYTVEAYQQLYAAGIATREGDLDFSDVALPETWSPSPVNDAGSITVSASPIRWIDFDRVQGKVVMWTADSVAVLHGPDTPNRPSLWSVRTAAKEGTLNGRTVQNVGGVWVWLADDAFCLWSGGGLEKVIAPIRLSFALIDWANIANACSWVTQEGQYVCQVPKVGGGTIWFTFDPDHGWYTDNGRDVRASSDFDISGRTYTILGDAAGNVYQVGGADDAGTAIAWEVVLGPTPLGDPTELNQLLRVDLVLTLGAGATASAAVGMNETGTTWGATKTITQSGNMARVTMTIPAVGSRSNVFRLRLWGSGPVTIHYGRLHFASGGF